MADDVAKLVERFYAEIWNLGDERVCEEILARDLSFRGSLDVEKEGRSGFIDYMRAVRAALGGYRCVIEDLVNSGSRAAAVVNFSGTHRSEFFGMPATGRTITWTGCAFFTAADKRITKIFVLGDIDALKRQLDAGSAATFDV